jgi:hypothetical protein
MNVRRIRHIALTVAGAGAIAATSTGITYAATASSPTVYACASSHGTLRLLAKGKCASGYKKVSINKQGPRGATGKTGKTGATGKTGKTGPQGPGGISFVTATTADTTVSNQVGPVGATGLQIDAVCNAGASGSTEIDIFDTDGTADYRVGGTVGFSGGSTAYPVYNGGQQGSFSTGVQPLSFTQTADKGANAELINTGGDLTANLLVTRSGHTFTVTVHSSQSSARCETDVQVTPAS